MAKTELKIIEKIINGSICIIVNSQYNNINAVRSSPTLWTNGEATRSPNPTTAPMFREMTLPTHCSHWIPRTDRPKADAQQSGEGISLVDDNYLGRFIQSVVKASLEAALILISP